ncbi:MAG TPA: XRE family transcriptional regulator [Bacteroidetes bacterium]|nr:XRE family transcriptional regulator [Bacteroidota bacterium]
MVGKMRNENSDRTARLGSRVKSLRSGAKLRQGELAERAGINRSYLSMIENGKSSPTVDVLERLARALHVSVSELMLYNDETSSDSPPGSTDEGESRELDLEEKHFEYDTGMEYDIYPGLRDFLDDRDEMMLAQPDPEEIRLLKSIRFSGSFRPDKRFYREALLSYRRSRESNS